MRSSKFSTSASPQMEETFPASNCTGACWRSCPALFMDTRRGRFRLVHCRGLLIHHVCEESSSRTHRDGATLTRINPDCRTWTPLILTPIFTCVIFFFRMERSTTTKQLELQFASRLSASSIFSGWAWWDHFLCNPLDDDDCERLTDWTNLFRKQRLVLLQDTIARRSLNDVSWLQRQKVLVSLSTFKRYYSKRDGKHPTSDVMNQSEVTRTLNQSSDLINWRTWKLNTFCIKRFFRRHYHQELSSSTWRYCWESLFWNLFWTRCRWNVRYIWESRNFTLRCGMWGTKELK